MPSPLPFYLHQFIKPPSLLNHFPILVKLYSQLEGLLNPV
jgi:hypothetical protein